MSFWYRISQPKLKWQTLTHQFQRCYLQISHAHSVNNTPHQIIRGCENQYRVNDGKPSDFCYDARFFATRAKRKFPTKLKPKSKQDEKQEPSGPRMNDEISANFVRLVTDDGHAVVSTMVALEQAKKLQLDLVEVQPNADPPVCKIMDFHKEKYKKQIMEKDRSKSKPEDTLRKGEKEIRFTGKIEAKDLKMKVDLVKNLMDRGHRVKCVALGNPADQDLEGLLSRLYSLIEDVAIMESGPQIEKRQAFIIVRHIKFASKKGSRKKASKVVGDNTSLQQSPTDPSSHVESDTELEEESDQAEAGVDGEDEVLYDRTPDENKATWSVFDENDDFDKVFDVTDGASSTGRQTNAKLETASSVENTISNFPRTILDSTRKDSVPSTPAVVPPPATQNRYKKTEPSNKFTPTTSMDNRGLGATNLQRPAPQTPSSHMNLSPSTRETKQDRTDASVFRNSKLPLDEIPKHEQSRPGPSSYQQPSYGGFSAPKAEAPGKVDPFANSSCPGPSPAPPSPQQPSYGAFSALKAEAPGKLHPPANSARSDSSRPGLSRHQQLSYGAFSASKAEAPGMLDPSANSSRPGPPSPQQPGYRAFTATKAEARPQQPSYGAFSAPKAEAPGKLDEYSNSARSEPRLPNQGNPSLSDASVPRILMPPTNDGPRPEQSHPEPPSSPSSSFGIFSASGATAPGKEGTASEVNRNKEGNNPFESTRNPSVTNLPSKSDASQREDAYQEGGQGRWGIFSEAKAQR